MCLLCCGKLCPLRYASASNENKGFEYKIVKPCCGEKYITLQSGTTAGSGPDPVPIGFTSDDHKKKCCLCAPLETWAVGDMMQENGAWKRGPLKYGIRNKASCFKTGFFACYAPEKEHCNQLVAGYPVVNTRMPIYSYAEPNRAHNEQPPYGSIADWPARDNQIGSVVMSNFLLPCHCCCAVPSGCPLNIKVEINEPHASELSDADKMKLGLFAMAPFSPDPLARIQPGFLPLPLAWFQWATLAQIGYIFGLQNTNTTADYSTLKEAFGNGAADTGDLIPWVKDMVAGAMAKRNAA